MKKLLIGIVFILSISAHSQNSCDSSLFYKLYRISQQDNITNAEFLYSLQLVDSLSYNLCDHIIILPDSVYSGLSYTFGQVCLKANSELAIKSFVKYRIKHLGSAEEILIFTLENLFIKEPEIILSEISKLDSNLQTYLLGDIIWGFVNNRYYGLTDPFEYNPYKASTNYENSSEPVINTNNYIDIFYKVHPKTKELIDKYPVFYTTILNGISNELDYQEERRNIIKE